MKFYFTFGCGQAHENCYHIIEADTSSEARKKMFERFGQKWSMQYDEKGWFRNGTNQAEEYNLKELK
jgi:hypothetical protein